MIYTRDPIRVDDGIPVFCDTDDFVMNYDLIGQDFLDHLDENGCNPWQTEEILDFMQAPTVKAILRYSNPGSALLEVGVSNGRMLKEITDRDLYGVDLSLSCLKRSRDLGIDVALANAESLPYPDDVFDMVVCTDVLEHVLDLNACLREVTRVLRSGGYLVVRVPHEQSLIPYLSPDCPYRFIHVRTFDTSTLVMLLTRVFAFTVMSCRTLTTEGSEEILMVLKK